MKNGTGIAVGIFSLLMAGMFLSFLFRVPVRTGTPQIFRLRYYACQDGWSGGTLSSSLSGFDWRKAFAWQASDTEYRQRQFSQFFEVLTPRFYAHLYYRFGPFMWLPLSLLMVFVIGFLIALVIRQWTGSWFPGLAAGSFWLMTSEVLVGHHAPVRYAKDFAAAEILGIVSLFLAVRSARQRKIFWLGAAAVLLWWAGLFTDEYIYFVFPALALALLGWPWLRPLRRGVLAALILAALAGLGLFLFVLPDFVSPAGKEPLIGMAVRNAPDLPGLLRRNLEYLLLNTWDNFAFTFGWPPPRFPLQTALAALSGVGLLLLVAGHRAWKGWGRMIAFWAVTTAAAGGILLPEGNDILHQITYYNRPVIALLMVLVGLFFWNIARTGKSWPPVLFLVFLTLAAGLNFRAISWGVVHDPEGPFVDRGDLEATLGLHSLLEEGGITPPVFVTYPRFRDVVNGVYNELEIISWDRSNELLPRSLYRSVMPRLYLRHFEEGELRANPRQFTRWKEADEHEYRAAANTLYDLPAGVAWDLEIIRTAAAPPPARLLWRSGEGSQEAKAVRDLLGEVPFVSLPAGRWTGELDLPEESAGPAVILAFRHQGATKFNVPEAIDPRPVGCSYGWAWKIYLLPLRPEAVRARIAVETEGTVEVIGPVVVPGRIVDRIRVPVEGGGEI